MYSPRLVTSSYGLTLQYLLIHKWNELGCPAKIICYESSKMESNLPDAWKDEVIYEDSESPRITKDDIVIYPEVIQNNPLHASKVVRFLYNKPIVLTGLSVQYGKTDYIVSYSNYIDPAIPQLFYLKDERVLFDKLRKREKKDQIAVYFGKTNFQNLSETIKYFKEISHSLPKRMFFITRGYPDSHEEMLKILADSKLLVSFDGMTNTNYEATLLGTPALILDNSLCIDPAKFNIPQNGFLYDYRDLPKKMETINGEYQKYCSYLERQDAVLEHGLREIFLHFQRIETDEDYREKIAKRNKEKIEQDRVIWSTSRKITFSNIDKIEQIPNDFFCYMVFSLKIKFIFKKSIYYCKVILKKIGVFDILKRWYLKIKGN